MSMDPAYRERLDGVLADAKATTFPNSHAVAVWIGESGSTYVWPQGMKDNRRSRILARIDRYGMEPPTEGGLVIFKVDPVEDNDDETDRAIAEHETSPAYWGEGNQA